LDQFRIVPHEEVTVNTSNAEAALLVKGEFIQAGMLQKSPQMKRS
jgi:hypothetical protein